MPSIKQELGEYVTLKGPRKDGTYRVLFEVKPSLRPSGWLPTRPLPRDSALRKGDLSDPVEVAAIIADARIMRAELQQARQREIHGETLPLHAPFSLADLAARWQGSKRWTRPPGIMGGLAPRTKKFYEKVLEAHILPWGASENHKDVRKLTRQAVIAYIDLYIGRPYVQRHIRATLVSMLNFAVDEGWMPTNPAAGIDLPAPEERDISERTWTPEDVQFYVNVALSKGWLFDRAVRRPDANWVGGARLIQGMWETIAREFDAMVWQRGVHYHSEKGWFDYKTNKTGERVTKLRISAYLQALLDETPCPAPADSPFLILNTYGLPYEAVHDDRQLTRDFARLRKEVMRQGGPYRVLREIRQSATNHALDLGATKEQVTGATAQKLDTVDIYERTSAERADQLQRLRGFI